MKTILTSIIAVTLCTTIQAGHHNARQLDDLAFGAYVNARELRWEIHDDFQASHEYGHLVDDCDEIIGGLRRIQDIILCERPDHLLLIEIQKVKVSASNLRSHFNLCGAPVSNSVQLGSVFGRRVILRTPGPTATSHVGDVHVRAALQLLDQMDQSLNALFIQAGGHYQGGHHHHRFSR